MSVRTEGRIDCRFFSALGGDLTERLLKNKIVKTYQKGGIISLTCGLNNKIMYVSDGIVKILTYLRDGREFVVETPRKGCVFGEIDILRPTKSVFEVAACTDCTVWILDGKIVRDAIGTDPDLSSRLLFYVARRVTELESRLICFSNISISTRLANALLRLSSVDADDGKNRMIEIINISQHELASMLPASREKVNKCLREWERSRIVDLEPGTIRITNPQALHAYAVC